MCDLTDHLAEEMLAREWSGGVMHADDRRIERNSSKTIANRLASGGPSCDSTFTGDVFGRNDDDDPITHRLCGVDGPVEDPLVGDQCVLFLATEPGT